MLIGFGDIMERKRLIIIISIIVLFIASIIIVFLYDKDKYTVSFETGTDEVLIDKYVSKNSKVNEPKPPIKDGYVFVEWQLDGIKYNFDSEVTRDIELTAKWAKNEYIEITFKDYDDKIEKTKILKGTILNDLPKLERDGYEFLGWYKNDSKYNFEELNSDTTLIAKYKLKEIKYNIGDKVKIIGKYSATSIESDNVYDLASGWIRYVIDIKEGTDYPYVVGNRYGILGFFKWDSLEHVN